MAFQPFNFNLPVQTPDYSGLANIFQNYFKGYEAAQTPQRVEQESRKREADIAYQLAHAEHYKGGGNLQGLARARADLYKLGELYGFDSPTYKNAERDFELQQQVQGSLVNQRQQIYEYRNLNSLPADQKEKIFGQYASLGADPRTGTELWNQGITPELIYAHKQHFPNASIGEITNFIKAGMGQVGAMNQPQQPTQPGQPDLGGELYDKVNPNAQVAAPVDTRQVPIQPAMTGTNRTDYNTLQANRAESAYLGTWVTEHNAPYTQFPTIKDAYTSLMKRNDPAAQRERHEFLAAQMMGPETALLNIKLAQGSSAAQAIADVEDRLKLNLKTAGITVTPDDYRAATRIMHDVLDKAADVRGRALQGQSVSQVTHGATGASAESGNFVIGITPKGKRVKVPADKIDEFIKQGGRRG